MLEGAVAPCSVIAYGPHRVAATLVPPEAFEELCVAQTELVTACYHSMPDGEYPAGSVVINLLPSQRRNAVSLLALPPATPVALTELSRKKVSQVHVAW